jgi:peptidyl-prolyl cis-trans isomerase D
MIQFFRRFFSSKIGIGVTLAFLALIALAFASSDVANSGMFGGVSGGDQVALIGDEKVSTSDLNTALETGLSQARQENPTATMEGYLNSGGMEQTLRDLIDRTAIAEWAQRHGFRAGDRLIDSEILQIPAFRDATGEFDQDAYDQILRQQGLSDAVLRQDLRAGLLAQQVLTPAGFGAQVPVSFAQRYAALLRESRTGGIALIPSQAFAPEGDVAPATLQKFYTENRSRFVRPERRVVRYASFGADAIRDLRAPTDAEIAQRYRQDADQYAATESRSFTQVVVPTQAAAQAFIAEVRGGKSIVQAAREKGLAAQQLESRTKAELTRSTSAAVANAAFAASRGGLAAPARGPLGFYILQVNSVDGTPARSLAQVRDEIAQQITTERRRQALAELSSTIEDRFDEGASLSEVAEELGIEVSTTQPIVATGQVYENPQERAAQIIEPALPTLFQMEEGEPQIAEIDPGKQFLVFDVARRIEAAPAPLSEITEQVTAAYKLDRGSAEARKAADRIIARLNDDTALPAALSAEDVALPRPERVAMSREELSQLAQQAAQAGRRIPPPLALIFSMAEGTAKRLEAPSNQGWFVVALEEIIPGDVEGNEELVQQTVRELSPVVGEEYARQLRNAMVAEIGVERNEAAIQAVEDQLLRRNEG